ncbi:ubiquitin carboxyl-terminal hydrolase 10-B isoform X2 [Belonocnema kinseyi]|uniref:ubiquitin carboxyl-terminal hydrolase 10-B isoform X2 n=1 Tax=Belonocnema kinseyi TaxID=2817044 RepID=UPI00143D6999|nr:ubiquitin carboxyl-terminal hydrolase 10-B isoform X2 [Belonocnema kinseyi]
MDVNMDLKYKNEYEFLDLSGIDLDDNERQRLRTYLRSNTSPDILKLPWDVGDNDYNDNSVLDQEPETPKSWQNYGTEGDVIKYMPSDTSGPIMMQTAVPQAHMFPTMVLAYHPGDWQNNVFVSNDMSIPYTTGGITYSSYISAAGNENQEIHSGREGGRRSGRGRGGKRESYNRNNQSNDISTGYFPVQCMGEQFPSMFCPPNFSEHTMISQQHPAVGQPVFSCVTQSVYPQQQIHHQSHTNYTQYHPSQTKMNYNRQSQSMQSNGESLKSVPKSYEKRGQNVHSKPFRQQTDEDNNSSQTIKTTFILKNNNVESCQNNTENTATSKSNNITNNKVSPVNVKIEHNIVSTRSETYIGNEKKEGPCVNIKSSIEIEQNGDNNEEFENETVSHIQTTVLKTHSKPASKPVEVESDVKSEVTSAVKGEESTPKKPEEVIIASVASPVPLEVSTLPTNTWASILKKNAETPLSPVTPKPTAFINPMNMSSPVVPSEETNTSQKSLAQVASKVTPNKSITPNQETQDKNGDNSHSQSKTVHVAAVDHDFDDPLTYRMGEFFLGYQMDKQTVSLLPRGLTNRSNYCYINSILQALLACPPFYNLLMALPYSDTASRRNTRTPLIDNMTKFVHEFTPLSEAARMPRKDRVHKRNEDASTDVHSGTPFEPSYVYTMLKNTSSVFSIEGRQEDAEEFLSCLLNGISDEMLEVMKLVNSDKSSNNNPNMNLNPGEEEWKVMGPKNKGSVTRCTDFGRTPLSDIFRGQLRSRVHRAGEQATDYVQPFFTLQLDIEKAESVKSALEILVGKDQVEGMTCSKTKQQIEAWKQVTLEELPVILVLHLKWFDYKLDGCSKILKNVEFPVDLKLDPKFLSPNASKKFNPKQKQYKLFAVTYHDGKEATKGHYVTDAFHVGYGGWVRYDDSSLKGISEGNVLHPQLPRVPYLLYYRRCDTIGNNSLNVARSR